MRDKMVNNLIKVTNDFTYQLQMTSTCTLERRRERTRRDSWRVSVRDKMVRLVKRIDTSNKRLYPSTKNVVHSYAGASTRVYTS